MGATAVFVAATVAATGYMMYTQAEAQKHAEERQKAQIAKENAAMAKIEKQGPAPQAIEPADTAGQEKRARIEATRRGLQSTIKTRQGPTYKQNTMETQGAKTLLGE